MSKHNDNEGYGFQSRDSIEEMERHKRKQASQPLRIPVPDTQSEPVAPLQDRPLTEQEVNAKLAERVGREGMQSRADTIRKTIREYAHTIRGGCAWGSSPDGSQVFLRLPGRTDALEVLDALMLGLIT